LLQCTNALTDFESKFLTILQASNNKEFLIDGFPRNKENLETWNELMGEKAKV
jgi:hypothetical protein